VIALAAGKRKLPQRACRGQTVFMDSTLVFRRIAALMGGAALLGSLAGCGGNGDSPMTSSSAPKVTTLGRSAPNAPAGGPLTISSPAFADGAPIPVTPRLLRPARGGWWRRAVRGGVRPVRPPWAG